MTGTTSGIGKAIAGKLVALGYRVYALARSHEPDEQANPVRLRCDLTRTGPLSELARDLARKDPGISVLVNNSGLGRFAPHEEIPIEDLKRMVETNLLAPMVLTRGLLRVLKANSGHVINVCSVAAVRPGHLGAAYAATKAGLLQFGECLFEEGRKHGLKVTSLVPDLTRTSFYDSLRFEPDDEPLAHLTPECVADAVEAALTARDGTVMTQVVLRPQLNRIRFKT
ncbi:MAG: SDR family oxidoreductase [Armatimonadetes bacterium]|nr:SDR family oxidoreductase [Armatimonadota bacterium]